MSISTDNFDSVDFVRGQKVLDAKEAIERGAYDAPGVYDVAFDNLVARAESELRIEAAFQDGEGYELQRMAESDR